ncbi:MAG: glycosyltransferase family 4 protein, partial [Limnochordaceae bacterium]|nr:glycosyltransferase family 4 protein [Limnochordaceae bacterium]
VHAHTFKAGAVARLAGAAEGVPTIYTPHGWRFMAGTPRLWQLAGPTIERFLARHAARIVCVSEYERQLALELGIADPEKLVVVQNGIPDVPDQARKLGPVHSLTQNVRAIMVGRFEPPKDQETLVRAVARASRPGIVLDLVGDGPTRTRIADLARSLGLGDRVRFLGERDDIPELLAESHVFVLASQFEGLPLVVLEAMRAGLPVVATGVGGVPEAVRDGVTGILVPPRNVEALAEALGTLASSARVRTEMGAAGRRLFLSRFTEGRMLQEIERIYRATVQLG